ncbi:MAG: YkgJ family cysteine cluster protein, partial [Planctomycetes bacterium]|nr:YkgJ family cysteine cluster protein [Planctomycetota bacterium]
MPIIEQWDCHGCGHCCRGTTIPLDQSDIQRLDAQQWQRDPDFRGIRTVVRSSLLGGRRVLAKRADGSCVFLTADGRCRIHQRYGADAKPAVCRMFPFQLVPLGQFAYITPRRSCPSAAADRGRPVAEHVAWLKKAGLIERFSPPGTRPPRIVRGVRRTWPEFLAAADALAHLMADPRFPLVRRVVHGLQFCELLGRCKLRRIESESWQELMQILESSSTDDVADFFRDRRAPSRSTAVLFRQIGVHYVRSHPSFSASGGWRERWRLLRASANFARGKGCVPPLLPDLPEMTFDDLERPLGPLAAPVANPLDRFFETHASSKQYVIVAAG